jgi:pyruvate ferredoxin oxidoreductase gamma subunit/2-oxoisovalerate ferredoxin oxidoreductase gamma subunit
VIQIRFHGRGGQGVVVATQVLAAAIFEEGSFTQAFPHFGAERRGAPVAAYLRIDRRPVLLRGEMSGPDHLVVFDESLLSLLPITDDLAEGGWIVVNSASEPSSLPYADRFRVGCVDANRIAVRHELGTRVAPMINSAILGAFSRLTGLAGIEAVCRALPHYVPIKVEQNLEAAREAFGLARGCEPDRAALRGPV